LHGYIYSRWQFEYVALALADRRLPWRLWQLSRLVRFIFFSLPPASHPGPKGYFAKRYHAKVVPTATAEELVTLDAPIHIVGTEQIIPFPTARDIILNEPDHIVALDCACRVAREEPCLPLDVCLIVGEPFAQMMATHHPTRTRWITQTEAVEILRAERDCGHIHHVFFNDAMLNRFYVICNCCNCCCGAMEAWQYGIEMLASSGYVAGVDSTKCVGCGTCASACGFAAIKIEGEVAHIDRERCMGCGVCANTCPQGAITLTLDPTKGAPLRCSSSG